jgi:hypothetical protein
MLYSSYALTGDNLVKFRSLRCGFRIFTDPRQFDDNVIDKLNDNSGRSDTDKPSEGNFVGSLIRHMGC